MANSAALWTVALRPWGFSRQEFWNGLPCPPSGDLPDPGVEGASLTSPALAGGIFTTSITWEARFSLEPTSSLHPHDSVLMRALCRNRRQNAAGAFCPKLEVTEDFPGCSVVKNPPTKQKTRVRSLSQEDSLEKEMATQYSFLGNPMEEEPWWATVHGGEKSQIQFSDKTRGDRIPTVSPSSLSPPPTPAPAALMRTLRRRSGLSACIFHPSQVSC